MVKKGKTADKSKQINNRLQKTSIVIGFIKIFIEILAVIVFVALIVVALKIIPQSIIENILKGR